MTTVLDSESSQNILIWRGIGIVTIVGHLFLLWASTLDFQDKAEVFYWQRFSSYLLLLRFLSFLIVPVSIWFLSKASSRVGLAILVTIVYCVILGYLNFGSIFYSTWITHVGTVELKGNTYQLAEVSKFDEPIIYYLGVCGKNGLVCTFHEVYRVSPFSEFVPEIILSDDIEQLIVIVNGEMVYNFDGVKENCIERDYGHCINN